MTNLPVTIGLRIKKAREALGLTQELLAERVHLNVSYLSQIERGVKSPSLEVLERVATGVNLPLSELFAEMETATPLLAEREVARLLDSVPDDRRKALLDLIRSGADLASR